MQIPKISSPAAGGIGLFPGHPDPIQSLTIKQANVSDGMVTISGLLANQQHLSVSLRLDGKTFDAKEAADPFSLPTHLHLSGEELIIIAGKISDWVAQHPNAPEVPALGQMAAEAYQQAGAL